MCQTNDLQQCDPPYGEIVLIDWLSDMLTLHCCDTLIPHNMTRRLWSGMTLMLSWAGNSDHLTWHKGYYPIVAAVHPQHPNIRLTWYLFKVELMLVVQLKGTCWGFIYSPDFHRIHRLEKIIFILYWPLCSLSVHRFLRLKYTIMCDHGLKWYSRLKSSW